jgi:P27 family predicted phage terminase small subunit
MGMRGPNAVPKGGQLRAAALTKAPAPERSWPAELQAAHREIGARAVELGVLTKADLPALEQAARTLAQVRELERLVERDGYLLSTATTVKGHPAVSALERARAALRAWLAEFGMTPRGRDALRQTPERAAAGNDARGGASVFFRRGLT